MKKGVDATMADDARSLRIQEKGSELIGADTRRRRLGEMLVWGIIFDR